MTRWKKNEKEFGVKLTNDYAGSRICRVPKPVLEFLGEPSEIKFVITPTKKVIVEVNKK